MAKSLSQRRILRAYVLLSLVWTRVVTQHVSVEMGDSETPDTTVEPSGGGLGLI